MSLHPSSLRGCINKINLPLWGRWIAEGETDEVSAAVKIILWKNLHRLPIGHQRHHAMILGGIGLRACARQTDLHAVGRIFTRHQRNLR